MKKTYNLPCNIAQTLNIIGDKWTLLILGQLFNDRHTYNELMTNLVGIPSNLLANRLKTLEEDGIITAVLYQTHPPRYKYVLTEGGRDLEDVLHSITIWGEKHLKKCYKELVHTACGEKVQLQYYCPRCQKTITKKELLLKNTIKEGVS